MIVFTRPSVLLLCMASIIPVMRSFPVFGQPPPWYLLDLLKSSNIYPYDKDSASSDLSPMEGDIRLQQEAFLTDDGVSVPTDADLLAMADNEQFSEAVEKIRERLSSVDLDRLRLQQASRMDSSDKRGRMVNHFVRIGRGVGSKTNPLLDVSKDMTNKQKVVDALIYLIIGGSGDATSDTSSDDRFDDDYFDPPKRDDGFSRYSNGFLRFGRSSTPAPPANPEIGQNPLVRGARYYPRNNFVRFGRRGGKDGSTSRTGKHHRQARSTYVRIGRLPSSVFVRRMVDDDDGENGLSRRGERRLSRSGILRAGKRGGTL